MKVTLIKVLGICDSGGVYIKKTRLIKEIEMPINPTAGMSIQLDEEEEVIQKVTYHYNDNLIYVNLLSSPFLVMEKDLFDIMDKQFKEVKKNHIENGWIEVKE